jgi:hypothetical protein
MIQKTKNYDLFKLRNDNRVKIDTRHIQTITDSIRAKNLLSLRPILVNGEMEIIDGQHRYLAAKSLGVEIFYIIQENVSIEEIVLMNTNKAWSLIDYLNIYCKNQYPEYLKLKNFIEKNEMEQIIGIRIMVGQADTSTKEFKFGKFKFDDQFSEKSVEICKKTIDFIIKMNGPSQYTKSFKFWRALIKLISNDKFDVEHWEKNYQKLVDRFYLRPNHQSYLKCMCDIYNYSLRTEKIELTHE